MGWNRMPLDRSASTVLVPRKPGALTRAVIVGIDGEDATFVDVDPIIKSPHILDEIAKGYARAIRIWDWSAAGLFWGSIFTSFLWQWWIFMPGILVATFLWRANRRSVARFVVGAWRAYPQNSANVFTKYGLMWRGSVTAAVSGAS